MSLILKQPQAEAVYSAMCALNNVGATHVQLAINEIEIFHNDEYVAILKRDQPQGWRIVDREDYGNQSAFAAAYGLQHDTERTS